jgi:peroxiredoxin
LRGRAGLAAMLWLLVAVGACSSSPRGLYPLDDLSHYLAEHKTLANVVLYHFWASSHAACLASLDQVRELHERYAGRGLVVLSVNLDPAADERASDERARAGEVIQRHGLDYPSFADPGGRFLRKFASDVGSMAAVRSLGVLLRDDLVVARGSLCRPGAYEAIDRALARILRE